MPKRRMTVKVRIPPYGRPRNLWRERIHEAARQAMDERGVVYVDGDRLELDVRIYLRDEAIEIHDVDNRLKDIMDALQGRVGGPKKHRRLAALVPNDNQIYRVVIEKQAPPWQSGGFGHLTVRQYRPRTT